MDRFDPMAAPMSRAVESCNPSPALFAVRRPVTWQCSTVVVVGKHHLLLLLAAGMSRDLVIWQLLQCSGWRHAFSTAWVIIHWKSKLLLAA